MPAKIITSQPEGKRRTLQLVLTTDFQTLIEAPYFSIPDTGQDSAIIDPDNSDRELRAGEVFLATGIQISNDSDTAQTVRVEMVGESGNPVTALSPDLTVPAKEIVTLSPGFSIFKRNLSSPTAPGMLIRATASGTGLHLTTTVVEREAIDHEPDGES